MNEVGICGGVSAVAVVINGGICGRVSVVDNSGNSICHYQFKN